MINIHRLAIEQMDKKDIDHYQGDLYLKITPISQKLISQYDYKDLVTIFIDNIDGVPWYEIPFAYTEEVKNNDKIWNTMHRI